MSELAGAVAIIGMSCRFAPDLDTPERFWEFLAGGRSCVGDMPEKRWAPYASSSPRATAIMRGTTRRGSFLDDIEGFDADFFGISPREADYLDPQQRFMLELAWEALGDAGVPPLTLRGSETGVYMAANSNDYGRRLLEDIQRTGAYAVNGAPFYGIANRISYFLDVRGPSMAVDTACAGSLTALHLACQSLQARETPVAIVGGINIMATPALVVALDAAGATAPDGRSKAFDAEADGYGRGEGAGVVVLKRLDDAVCDGDRIHAVVRGTGVFQDGRSDGMMAPDATAQEEMLRRIYDRASVRPASVSYVEAHGTGTPVGDREEAAALAAVFGAGRPEDRPCLVGSVKPNIGHTEGGSGIAGVIKTVLSLRHEELPPSLHGEPSSEIDWLEARLQLVAKRTPWPSGGEPRRAGVSSYGVGGTIAHAIIEEPPAAERRAVSRATGPAVYPVSSMSEAGMRAMAGAVADWLAENPLAALDGVGHTLAERRSHLSQRGAVVAGSAPELAAGLQALAEGRPAPGVTSARTGNGTSDAVVWVFSGHGAHWSGMGRELLDEPVFADAIDGLADLYRSELGWTPREAIVAGGPWSTAHVQAMTFAMQIGLAALWRSRGIAPGAVVGHSVGEIAASVTAGALDLYGAARFACRRATALQRLEGRGGMALVGLAFDEARQALAGRADVVAAISASPASTVVSGDRAAVGEVAERLRAAGVQALEVDTDVAFHSHHVDDVLDEVRSAAAELVPAEPDVPLYCSTLENPRAADERGSRYWAANLRNPVRFAEAVGAAVTDGYRLFLEISSHPVVAHSVTETLDLLEVDDGVAVGTIRRGSGAIATLLGNLAELACNGAAVDWSAQHGGADLTALPPAAWQHRPYWIFSDAVGETGSGGGHDPDRHSLLGGRMTVSGAPTRQVWQTHLDMSSRPYPLSHEVVGVEITPAASIINTFLEAAAPTGPAPAIRDIVLRTPLAVAPPRVVQIVASEDTLRLSTRVAGDTSDTGEAGAEWITHTTAVVDRDHRVTPGTLDADALRARLPEGSWAAVDDMFRAMGVGGYAFPWTLDELRRDDTEQLAVMTIEPDADRATSWAHVIDGALTISAVVVTPPDAPVLWMSRGIERVAVDGVPPARILVHSRRAPTSPHDTTDVLVADETGRVVAEVTGLRFAAVEHLGAAAGPRDLVHEIAWRPLTAGGDTAVEQVVLVGDAPGTGPLATALRAAGVHCAELASPDDLDAAALGRPGAVLVAPSAALPGERPEDAARRTSWTLVRSAQRVAGSHATGQRIWALTADVRGAAQESSIAHGPLWGIARIVAGEHPEIFGGVLDLGPGVAESAGLATRLLGVLRTAAGAEDVVSLTADGTSSARLAPVERAADGPGIRCRPDGTYLVTGGLGALGVDVARWLADRGARRILLAGRRPLPPRSAWNEVTDPAVRLRIDGVLSLEAVGVTVRVVAVDITDAKATAVALDPATHGLPPVRGVVHAAGVTRDAMVSGADEDGLGEVLAPKADGAMVLHRLFPPGTLDFLVLFSSCGQFARLTGQASYAAANSFLDALAAHRNAAGYCGTVSLGWTSWQGLGMSEAIGTTMLEANSRGLGAITATEAFRAWAFADRFRSSYQAVLRVLPTPPHQTALPMFRELTAAHTPDVPDAAGRILVIDWSDPAAAEDTVVAEVREQVAAELNLEPDGLEPRRALVELGVDSVMTVALRIRLQRRFGLDLPPTILWSCPTVAALSAHLLGALAPHDGDAADGEGPTGPA
jgi:acyl transferase domain-containing protein/acyl carrier protein/NADP-dependent 3-hydroxy acid dehydrogenase YdfG